MVVRSELTRVRRVIKTDQGPLTALDLFTCDFDETGNLVKRAFLTTIVDPGSEWLEDMPAGSGTAR